MNWKMTKFVSNAFRKADGIIMTSMKPFPKCLS
jgi:hypothetical protein